jgi:hypothetical protein
MKFWYRESDKRIWGASHRETFTEVDPKTLIEMHTMTDKFMFEQVIDGVPWVILDSNEIWVTDYDGSMRPAVKGDLKRHDLQEDSQLA